MYVKPITSYTLNVYSFIFQLSFNKAEKIKNTPTITLIGKYMYYILKLFKIFPFLMCFPFKQKNSEGKEEIIL